MFSEAEDHITDWLPAYVLDALTEEEMCHVGEHLAKCLACQAELARFQRVADELPLAVPPKTPPAELKVKLMSSIHSQLAKTVTTSNETTISQKPAGFFRSHLLAFSLAAIVLLAIGNLLLWRQLSQVNRLASTPGRVVTLSNTQFSPGAIGTLVINPDEQNCTLVVDKLAALSPDKQYQVWLIKGTQHISAALFSVDPSGFASLQFTAPESISQFDAIGISIEPSGGSPAPTGSAVFHAYLIQ